MSLTLQRRFALARGKRRAMKSRVNREVQARFREGLGVKSAQGLLDKNLTEIRDQWSGVKDQRPEDRRVAVRGLPLIAAL